MARATYRLMRPRLSSKAFTLVELLITMGLMGMLATISIAGYYGAVRGMTERGATQDVVSFIRLAQQRALIDQVPTAVFFMNRYLAQEDPDTGAPVRMVGEAVAVRMAGRISCISGNYLADEYADLERTYPVFESASAAQKSKSGFRLYRMVQGGSLENCYSTVKDYVKKVSLPTEDILGLNTTTNAAIWAFEKTAGDGNASWRVGDPYGAEIASLRLPHGYIFDEGSLPTKLGQCRGAGKPVFFFPEGLSYNATGQSMNFSSVSIKAYHPGMNTSERSRTITKSDLKDDASN